MSKYSEFGRGFIYNLLLYNKHLYDDRAERISLYNAILQKSPEEQKEILADSSKLEYNYGWNAKAKFWFEEIVPTWNNNAKIALASELGFLALGALDHLKEIHIPKNWIDHTIGIKIQKLRDKTHAMCFPSPNKIPTYQDLLELRELVYQIVLAIDKELNVETQEAKYD